MSKKSSTPGGQSHAARFIPSQARSQAAPEKLRVPANGVQQRTDRFIYIWQDADDGRGVPRSGTYAQYTRRQTMGKARLTAIVKPNNAKSPLTKGTVVREDRVGEPVLQWVIEAHSPASAVKTLTTVAQAMRAGKPEKPSERAGTVPVDPELLKSAGKVTGIMDPAELVRFALSLLLQPDLSGDVMRKERGAAPGFELDY